MSKIFSLKCLTGCLKGFIIRESINEVSVNLIKVSEKVSEIVLRVVGRKPQSYSLSGSELTDPVYYFKMKSIGPSK